MLVKVSVIDHIRAARNQGSEAKVPTVPAITRVANDSQLKRDPKTGRMLPGGPSLNPGGRPKMLRELLEAAEEVARPWEYMAEVAAGRIDAHRPELRFEAARLIIAYKYGRPANVVATVDLTKTGPEGSVPVDRLSEAALSGLMGTLAELDALESGQVVDGEIVRQNLPAAYPIRAGSMQLSESAAEVIDDAQATEAEGHDRRPRSAEIDAVPSGARSAEKP